MTEYSKLDGIVEGNQDIILDMADTVWNTPELGYHEVISPAYEGTVFARNGFNMSDRGIGGIHAAMDHFGIDELPRAGD